MTLWLRVNWGRSPAWSRILQFSFAPTQEALSKPGLFSGGEKTAKGMRFVTHLDPKVDLGLDDHRVDGIPLLPGVLGVELMVQALNLCLDEPVTELRDVRFQKPVKFFNDDAMDIYVEVEVLEEGHAKALLSTELTTPKRARSSIEPILSRMLLLASGQKSIGFCQIGWKCLAIPS